MTARARIASSFAPTLTKLNAEKRDLRSLDEITRDLSLKKGKEVASEPEDKASNGVDWFGKKKDKAIDSSRPTTDNRKDHLSSIKYDGNPSNRKSSPSISGNPLKSKSGALSNGTSSSSRSQPPKKSSGPSNAKGRNPDYASTGRKRSRGSSELDYDSDSYDSDDRRPTKRSAHRNLEDEELGGDMRDLIWGIMGKNRKQYVSPFLCVAFD
jgi:hypothetical protein